MLVRRVEETSRLRLHSEQIEIIAGDLIAVCHPHRVMPAEFRAGISINPGHSAEGGISLPKILQRGIRRSQQSSSSIPETFRTNLIEALRVAHIQRLQQDRIQYSEDHDVCPDAQHQSD